VQRLCGEKTLNLLMFTIDAEGVHGNRPFEQFMLGEVGESEPWGIELQAKIFNLYGVQATFFLDVYEHSFYGEDVMKHVVETLLKYNQDVQLHTHPGWFEDPRDFDHVTRMRREKSCFDYKRPWMWCYSLNEQIEILEHGIDCLKRWGAGMPVAHRAGAYGLNKDTITALKKVGIPIDSSMFWGHTNCKEIWGKNQVIKKNDVMEIPVTGYFRDESLTIGPIKINRYKGRFVKTDIDSCSLKELIWFSDQILLNKKAIMNYFMHSYSLLSFDERFKKIKKNPGKRASLEGFLEHACNNPSFEICSMKEFSEKHLNAWKEGVDFAPKKKCEVALLDKVFQKIKKTAL
jgi:hypothetical protein